MRIAQQAEAASVISVLKASGMRRTEEKTVDAIVVYSNVHPEVAGRYSLRNGRNLSKHSPLYHGQASNRRTHLSTANVWRQTRQVERGVKIANHRITAY